MTKYMPNNAPIQDSSLITRLLLVTNYIETQLHINNVTSTKKISALISILVIIIAIIVASRPSPTCDMSKAENRDFDRFYGITGMENHFTHRTADHCTSTIIFRPALPVEVLKADNSASSFIVSAKYGTGKTLLRCEYMKSLPTDRYLQITIFNKEIDVFLDQYIEKLNLDQTNYPDRNCFKNWSGNDFAQIMLSTFVTNLVDMYYKSVGNFPDLPPNEKIDLISIICYYYNKAGVNELENFINTFLGKQSNALYRRTNAQPQIQR